MLVCILFNMIQGGPLKSSPENIVEKKNILLLFKLPVMLYNLWRDQATFKWATFSILAYSLLGHQLHLSITYTTNQETRLLLSRPPCMI